MSHLVRARPITVDVGPGEVTIPARAADRWISAVMEGTIPGVLPGMLRRADATDIVLSMAAGGIRTNDVQDAALHAVKEAAGRDWWEAFRLVSWCHQGNGELYGRMILAGVDPARLTFSAWCAAVRAHILSGLEEKQRIKIEFDLSVPPPGFEPEADSWDTGIPAGFSAELPPGTA